MWNKYLHKKTNNVFKQNNLGYTCVEKNITLPYDMVEDCKDFTLLIEPITLFKELYNQLSILYETAPFINAAGNKLIDRDEIGTLLNHYKYQNDHV